MGRTVMPTTDALSIRAYCLKDLLQNRLVFFSHPLFSAYKIAHPFKRTIRIEVLHWSSQLFQDLDTNA